MSSNGLALTSLPDEIGLLPQLQELNLRSCSGLAGLPPTLGRGLPSLQSLNLMLCKRVSSLPESIGELQALQTLLLGGLVDILALPPTIVQLRNLVTLSLYNCSGLTKLPEKMNLLASLQVLQREVPAPKLTCSGRRGLDPDDPAAADRRS